MTIGWSDQFGGPLGTAVARRTGLMPYESAPPCSATKRAPPDNGALPPLANATQSKERHSTPAPAFASLTGCCHLLTGEGTFSGRSLHVFLPVLLGLVPLERPDRAQIERRSFRPAAAESPEPQPVSLVWCTATSVDRLKFRSHLSPKPPRQTHCTMAKATPGL